MQQPEWIPEAHYRAAAKTIRQRIQQMPSIGLILGSGLGTLAEEIKQPASTIVYEDIPHWPHATVPGHAGKLVIGQLENHSVVAMQGRVHFYEGYSMAQVALPVRVMRLLGVHTLIVTNAAGGLNPDFKAGDLMVIQDHINLAGMAGNNPLYGPNIGSFGPRFPILTRTYNPELRHLAHQVARENNLLLREGVYVSLSGPSFETPAEIRMLRAWGGDAVGMSTAPEVVTAYHAGMRTLGFCSIANMALSSTHEHEKVSHEGVLQASQQIVPRLVMIIRGVLRQMPPYDPAASENQPEL